MNLLFDQNISFRLIKKINDIFPDSKKIKELGFEQEILVLYSVGAIDLIH